VAAEEDLRGDREDVGVLGVGQVAEEGEEVDQVVVPEEDVERFGGAVGEADRVPELVDGVSDE
jgi:acyl CoA:acetate/3-ketoacid CoA transferase beta subunit